MRIEDKFDTVENFLEYINFYYTEESFKNGAELLKTDFKHILNKINNGLYTVEFEDILNSLIFQDRDFIRKGLPVNVFKILELLKKENKRIIKNENYDIYEFVSKRG